MRNRNALRACALAGIVAAAAPAHAARAAPDGACAGFYGAGFELVAGKVVKPWTAPPKPARGVAAADPGFGTCVVRVTDHAADGMPGFARNDYSRRQAFNADSTRQLVYADGGRWHLYDADHRHLGALPGPAGDAEPQWHPSDPGVLHYLPNRGVGMRVLRLDVVTGATVAVGELGGRLRARWPGAHAAWTGSEGSPSADGRYWCFMVDSAGSGGLGLATWDLATDTVTGLLDLDGQRPDHVSMSPSGQHCVASNPRGQVVAHSRDFASRRQVAAVGTHSDIGLDAGGDDVYVSIDFQSGGGDVFMVNLRTGVRAALFPTYLDGTYTSVHFSAKSFDRPGWFVMSAYGEATVSPPYRQQWLHRRVTVVQMAPDPEVYSLAETRARAAGYWSQPHASVNRDLTKVAWTSNWGADTDTDVDVYLVQIPAEAVGGPPPPPARVVAGFAAAASGLAVSFADASSGAPTAWRWDFGDGNTSTARNRDYAYAAGGTYAVCLTATNADSGDVACRSVAVAP